MYLFMNIHTYTQVHIHIQTRSLQYGDLALYTHTHAHAFARTHTHLYMDTHTHTHKTPYCSCKCNEKGMHSTVVIRTLLANNIGQAGIGPRTALRTAVRNSLKLILVQKGSYRFGVLLASALWKQGEVGYHLVAASQAIY